MIKVSVMYQNTPGHKFDHAYYANKHMPMVKSYRRRPFTPFAPYKPTFRRRLPQIFVFRSWSSAIKEEMS